MKNKILDILVSYDIEENLANTIANDSVLQDFIHKNDVDSLVLEKTKEITINSEITSKLIKAKALNIKACTSLIDMSLITLNDDGKIEGLDEQIEQIIKENPFLFENSAYEPASGTNKADVSAMTDNEYFSFLKQKNNGGF